MARRMQLRKEVVQLGEGEPGLKYSAKVASGAVARVVMNKALEALGQEKDVFTNLLKAVGEFDKDAFADLEEEIVALFVSFKKRRSAA